MGKPGTRKSLSVVQDSAKAVSLKGSLAVNGGVRSLNPTVMHAIGPTVLRYVLSRRAAHEIGKATAYRYRTILIGLAQIIGTDTTMSVIRRAHIDRWFGERDKNGISPSTLSHEYSIVRSFFRWAVDNELILRSPCDGLKGPTRPESQPKSMEGGDVSRTLDACPDARARAIVVLMVQCGLRCCEISRMETSDINLHDRAMLIHGKGDKERFLPIPDEARSAFVDYFAEYPPLAGPVFRSYHHANRGLSPGRVGEIVRIAMTDAGVKKRARDGKSAHALRHTFASDLVELGVDVEDIRRGLGHAHLSSTGIYTKKFRSLERLAPVMEGRTYRLGPEAPKTMMDELRENNGPQDVA